MAKSGFSVVILAAGKATRFKSARPKALHPLAGRLLGEYALRAALAAGADRTYMVVGFEAGRVRATFENYPVQFIEQKEQLGTGHALMVAREELSRCPSSEVIVLVGDIPLIRTETLLALAEAHSKSKNAATVLTTRLDDPAGYGRIVRAAEGGLHAIVEEKVATAAEKKINEVNSGIMCFSRVPLLDRLDELSAQNAQGEYLLTDLVGIFNRSKLKTGALLAPDAREVMGVNDRSELARIEKILRLRKAEALMGEGVTIVDPEAAYIDETAEAGPDTRIEPGVSLLGATRVGSGCLIEAHATVADSKLGDRVVIRQGSLISGCAIASGAVIGPFAHLRDGAKVEEEARIGNFVEVKKTRVGRGARALHLTYLGDATLGEKVNIGAGTVTCNYDGEKKNPTFIERGAFIGSGTMLVAPVRVGEGAYVGAGSTITGDVPPNALALARAPQVNKEGWAEKRAREKAGVPSPAAAAEAKPEENAAAMEPLQHSGVAVLTVPARLTYGRATDSLREQFQSAIASGRTKMVVDLGGAAYIDSAGLGALASALISARREGGDLKLAAVATKVMAILAAANLQQAFEIYPTKEDAVSSFKISA